jgi:hypothetical protein
MFMNVISHMMIFDRLFSGVRATTGVSASLDIFLTPD